MPTQTQQKKLTKQQIQGILDSTPKHIATDDVINGLVGRGFILEGLNDQPTTQEKNLSAVKDRFKDTKDAWSKSIETSKDPNSSILDVGKEAIRAGVKTFGNTAGAINDVIGNEITGLDKAITGGKVTDTISKVVQPIAEPVMEQVNKYVPEGTLARDTLDAAGNIVGLTGAGFATKGAGKVVKSASPIVKEGVENMASKVANSKVITKAGEKISSVTDNFTDPVKALENSYDEIFTTSGIRTKKKYDKSLAKSTDEYEFNPSRFLAEKNIVVDVADGKFNPKKSMDKIFSDAKEIDGLLTEGLKGVQTKVNLDALKQVALQKIDTLQNKAKGSEYKQMQQTIIDEIDAYKENFGEAIDISTLNDMKSGQWAVSGFDATKSNAAKNSHKALGNAFKEEIENVAKNNGLDGVAELNRYLGEHYETAKMLESLNGSAVKGGRLGNMSSAVIGGMAGATGIGSVFGTLGGAVFGGATSNILQGLKVSNPIRDAFLKRLQKESPDAVKKFQDNYLKNTLLNNQTTGIATNPPNIKSNISPIIPKITKKVNPLHSSLINEAKKYKSAEEFVKAQGTPVYHGTKSDIGLKDLSAQPESRGQYLGNGIYFTKYKEGADLYGGKTLDAIVNEKDFLNVSNLKGLDKTNKIGSFGTYKQYLKNNNLEDTATNLGKWKANQQNVSDKILKMGYKGVTDGQQHVVFDKSALTTKSQLTDIWNKANQATPETNLISEARKYKSAEEFVKSQGTKLYHGTTAIFDKFKQSNAGEIGKGVYFYDDLKKAENYAVGNGRVIEAYVQGKWASIEEFRQVKKQIGDNSWTSSETVDELSRQGFVGIKRDEGVTVDYNVFDPKDIKTKQELVDVWNKAKSKRIRYD